MKVATSATWGEDLRMAARRLSAGLWAGLICGALVGGIGGRIAMFVLRLTSDSSLRGRETDDGFIIGDVTGDSFFLILFVTAIGTAGGVFYLGVRGWIPKRHRALAMGLFGGAVGGAAVIHPDGIDFVVLEPLWLAIVMFIALPALYGVAMSALCEALTARAEGGKETQAWVGAILPLLAALVLGPIGLLVIAVLGLGWVINRQVSLARLWRSQPVTWLGRTALVAIGTFAVVVLIGDVTQIL
jgi:hypothetical protein